MLTHHIETSGEYEAFAELVQRAVARESDVNAVLAEIVNDYARDGVLLDEDGARRELVAKYAGEYLSSEENVRYLARENRGVFDRIREFLRDIVARFRGEDARTARDLLKTFDRALESVGENEGNRYGARQYQFPDGTTSYSTNVSFDTQLEEVLSGKIDAGTTHLNMGETPSLYGEFGLRTDLPILITANHVRSMNATEKIGNSNPHGLTKEQISRIPQALSEPVMVMVSNSRSDSLVIVTDILDNENRPVIVAIKPDGKGYYLNADIDANVALSGYGRNGFSSFVRAAFEDNRIMQIDNEKSRQLQQIPGVQFPDNLLSGDFGDNIARFAESVKQKREQKTKNKTVQSDVTQDSRGRTISEINARLASMTDEERATLVRENEQMQKQVAEIRQQLRRTPKGKKDARAVRRSTIEILRAYDSKADAGEISERLQKLYDRQGVGEFDAERYYEDFAEAMELFTTGTLDVFAHQTNINSQNRILCFDIQDLGENLKPIGLLVMLDAIMNRVISNRAQGKYTHVYIDEIYLFFAGNGMSGDRDNVSKYSAEFLYKCWKRFRKYYATLTGITQNVEECLRSDTARMMFANSEFLLMFNQAANDREVLAHILNASPAQMSYVSDKPPGHGLIKVGGSIVPLVNEFPKDTNLYWLMTTKPGEG